MALPQAVSATLALMGGFMFVLGWADRRQSHLAYFGALSIGWAIAESRLWLRDLPFENAVAEFLLGALLPMLTLAAVQFLLRHARLRLRWVDLALPLQCAVMPLSLVAAGPERLYPMASFWYVLLALQTVAAAAFYLRRQYRDRRRSFWPMAVLLAVAAGSDSASTTAPCDSHLTSRPSSMPSDTANSRAMKASSRVAG